MHLFSPFQCERMRDFIFHSARKGPKHWRLTLWTQRVNVSLSSLRTSTIWALDQDTPRMSTFSIGEPELTSSFIRHDLPLALSFSIGVTPLQDSIPNYFLTLQARSLVKVAQWQRGLIWTHDHPATVDTAVKWLTAEPSAGAALTKQTHQHAQWPNAHFDKRRRGAEIRELVHACVRSLVLCASGRILREMYMLGNDGLIMVDREETGQVVWHVKCGKN